VLLGCPGETHYRQFCCLPPRRDDEKEKRLFMELTEEHKHHIEVIKSRMRCPLDFKCEKSGFADYPKVKQVGKLIGCLQEDTQFCTFSLSFGKGYFCRCPLNEYIQKLKGKTR
jgi:hypothetical protein